jgi:alpha-glucosidase
MVNDFLWWRDGVIYQIYPRSFNDSNGDGIGDLPGISAKLDYLQDLGVDAIWLSPINPSPDKDFGYDISNYEDIDPKFGTLQDFDKLVSEAHQRDIRVIMDGVYNHTSNEHPWFKQSRSSKDNPYRDWYIWRPARPNGKKPNNWQSVFGGDGWEFDPATGEYYFHMFVKEQPDLNWRNPAVPRAILEAIRFWLDRGVDGFRLDVFNAYFKHPDLPDNPPKFGIRGFDRQHHIHDSSQPEMMPFLADLRELLDAYPERYAVGESFLRTSKQAAEYMGENALHAAFDFDFLHQPFRARNFLQAIQNWEDALGKEKHPNFVLNNHDNPRTATRYRFSESDVQGKLAMLLLCTLRGTPYLYYGEEIGMRDIQLSRSEILDPPGKKFYPFYKGRDGCRSPMQWDAQVNAGFSSARPWLPVHPNYINRNVEKQLADPDSLLNFYRKILAYRKHTPAFARGEWHPHLLENRNLLAYRRTYQQEEYLVILNFSSGTTSVSLPVEQKFTAVISTGGRKSETVENQMSFDAYEGIILQREL